MRRFVFALSLASLAERNVPHVWHIDAGGGHTFPVWKNDLYHLSTLLFR